MTVTPAPNVGSQIERAIIALFHQVWPVDTVARPNFYFSNDWKARKFPLIDVLAVNSSETPDFSASKDYAVTVEAKWPGANQPGETNLEHNWVEINNLIGVTESALRLSSDSGQSYLAAALLLSAAGRRLAVLGLAPIYGTTSSEESDLANNADMSNFFCSFVLFKSDMRAGMGEQGIQLVERRHWMIRAGNLVDDSVFPSLTFNGVNKLDWTFTQGGIDDGPASWLVQKSVDGVTWATQEVLATAARESSSIAGTGTQYWRVCRSADGVTPLDPESNLVKATA